MKILYVAPASDFTFHVRDALQDIGHSVTYLNDRVDYSVPYFIGSSRLWWRVRRRISWLRRRSNDALQKKILSAPNYDALLAGKGMNIQPATLNELTRRGIITAVWFPDNAANEPYASWVKNCGPLWSHFFSFDSAIHGQINDSGAHIHTLPFAVDIESLNPEPVSHEEQKRYLCDVVFVGAPYPDRVKLLEALSNICTVHIYGWSGWGNTSLAAYYRGPLTTQEASKAYRCAKISLNTNVLPRARGVNLKTFEICVAGGFQLTDVCEDLVHAFEPHRELEVFEGEEQCVERVRYWLAHDAERKQIAQAGYERVVRDHTLKRRMLELMHILET